MHPAKPAVRYVLQLVGDLHECDRHVLSCIHVQSDGGRPLHLHLNVVAATSGPSARQTWRARGPRYPIVLSPLSESQASR